MPRRTTRTVKRKESVCLDEDLLKEIPVLLRDYEGQLQDTIRQIEESSDSSLRAMRTQYLLNQRKLPKTSRTITLESYAPKEDDEIASLHDQTIDLVKRANAIKSTAKCASTRKQKLQSARKAAAGGSTVRRSNRTRVEEETPLRTTRAQQHQSLVTPAVAGAIPTAFGRTPFITPKFNTMTPLTRTLHRQAKPNETLVSLDGSPVMATVARTGRGKKKEADAEFAQIPLGRNLTLNLPIGQDFEAGGLELDEEQRDKLALIQQGISNMLKIRTASSSSTE